MKCIMKHKNDGADGQFINEPADVQQRMQSGYILSYQFHPE